MTKEQHNKYLAIAFFVHGAIHVLWLVVIGLLVFLFFSVIPHGAREAEPPLAFFALLFGFVVMIQLAVTLPSFIAGYALLKTKRWARIAGIVEAVPIGTAVCVYALWFLLSKGGNELYPS